MERSFAGFWRDGAKVQPEGRHLDADKTVLAKHKKCGSFDIYGLGFSRWGAVYWLDTTTPTELTPQEAFELLKVISPTTNYIQPRFDCEWIKAEPFKPIINWGDTTEYPPKQKWRVPTDADKGKRCRYWDNGEDVYTDGTFYTTTMDGRYLVFDDDDYLPWDCCEVLDE